MVGDTYYLRGRPVVVLVAWLGPRTRVKKYGLMQHLELVLSDSLKVKRTAPRNVLVRCEDGTLLCRPFRGLLKNPPKRRAKR
jgi:hypothetical protein